MSKAKGVIRARPPFERMAAIVRALLYKPAFVREIAVRFEVSHKTIYRDLEFLRDRLQMPVGFKSRQQSYQGIYLREKCECPFCGGQIKPTPGGES